MIDESDEFRSPIIDYMEVNGYISIDFSDDLCFIEKSELERYVKEKAEGVENPKLTALRMYPSAVVSSDVCPNILGHNIDIVFTPSVYKSDTVEAIVTDRLKELSYIPKITDSLLKELNEFNWR
jgi:hypothetical protein